MNTKTAERQQLDTLTEQLAAGDWPTDGSWPYDYPKPTAKRTPGYKPKHRLGDVDPQFVTAVAIPVSEDAR